MSTLRTIVVAILIVGAATGCGEVDADVVEVDFCQERDCNSPIANGFPINGFSTAAGGVWNHQGTLLMPGSLSGGRCGEQADLTFSAEGPNGPRLVGKWRDRECELTGAKFEVRSRNEEQGADDHGAPFVFFTIAGVGTVKSSDGLRTFDAYRITVESESGKSVCDPDVADFVRDKLGLPPVERAAEAPGYVPSDDDELVIAVPGPLYDMTDSTIAGTGEGWFNLACVGDALAKRSLWGLYTEMDDPKYESMNETALDRNRGALNRNEPARSRDEAALNRNETALKAITARYCRHRASRCAGPDSVRIRR